MAPEPRMAASETEVARPSTVARRRSIRRWPLLWMIVFATGSSLLLWAGIFALISTVSAALS